MTIKKCDRCGITYGLNDLHTGQIQYTDNDTDTFVDRDLCPKCNKAFIKFMNNEPVEPTSIVDTGKGAEDNGWH